MVIDTLPVHGYSLLRTQINSDYFNDLFDESVKFQVPLEGHRKLANRVHILHY